MDNVTHSLIGVLAGEAILLIRRRRRARLRSQAPARPLGLVTEAHSNDAALRAGVLWTSVLANNFPDFDFLMRPLVGGGGLGYLLHHRGYTHTLLMALPEGALSACLGAYVFKRISGAASLRQAPWRLLGLTGLVGVCLHIFADSWNNYGVHPFWPFDNRWFYGDLIFIVEPYLWLTLLPFAYGMGRSKTARAACLTLAAAMLGLTWLGPFLAWPVALAVTLWGASWAWAGWRLKCDRERGRQAEVDGAVVRAGVTVAAILAAFALSTARVSARLKERVPAGESLLQVVSTPAPGNPLCHQILLMTRNGDDYHARVGVMGLASERCFVRGAGERTAPLVPVTAPGLAFEGVTWHGEFNGKVSELEKLTTISCRARMLMRFARVPYWIASSEGKSAIVGDLRYDREPGLGFAEIEARAGDECLRWIPPWKEPSGLF